MLWRYMSASLIQTIWCAHLRRMDSDPIESTAEMAIMMTRLEAGMRNLTRLADCIDIRGWYHHYRAFNKMADSAANLAMDTRTSTQVHFPTHRAAFNNLTQDLDNDVMHWLVQSSEDPRSLDNTRQPHIGPREHAILVKDYLAFRSDLVQSAL
ncbi:hypothetical protein FI667_g11698, partial [Globisporangium splendens]